MLITIAIGIAVITPIIYYHVARGWHIIQFLKFKKKEIKEKEDMIMVDQVGKPEAGQKVKELDVNDVMYA